VGLEHATWVGVDADGRFLARTHRRDLGFPEVGLDPGLVIGNQRKGRRASVSSLQHPVRASLEQTWIKEFVVPYFCAIV